MLFLGSHHKNHLKILISQSQQAVTNFCQLTIEYLDKGPIDKLYMCPVTKEVNMSVDVIQDCIFGLINLVLLATRHQLNEADVRDSILALGFSEELSTILVKFYASTKADIVKICGTLLELPYYYNLEWRFEVQLASRNFKIQITPSITLDLTVKTSQEGGGRDCEVQHLLMQTDPTNLLHLLNELEKALAEAKSQHSKKVQRILNKFSHKVLKS